MKTIFSHLQLAAFALLVVAPSAWAQLNPGPIKGPVAKIYIAEVHGEAQIGIGDKIHPARQSAAFDAQGTVIETLAKARATIVYSNGTGMFVDENTRVEIGHFTQQPFELRGDNTLDSTREPSISHSSVTLIHGAIGICTSQLLPGSSMVYSTPHASVVIRGGKLVIEVVSNETHVDLLEGEVTVGALGKEMGGQVLHAGERAVIRPASAPGLEPVITLMPIPDDARKKDEQRVASACAARKAVTFEAIALAEDAAGAGDQEIVPRPTVPTDPPTNVVISPDRLPGT